MSIPCNQRVLYFSTYPPTECGLATFTQDLASAAASWNLTQPAVIAIEQGGEKTSARPPEVLFVVRRDHELDYIKAAKMASDVADVVSIQHEFGIFGGENGEFVLTFLKHLRKSSVVTLHTVLSHPDPGKLAIIREMSYYVDAFVCMNRLAIPILEQVYGLPPHKIFYIPHGAPSHILEDKEGAKSLLGLSGRTVLSTFGLLSPGKGIEYAIEALPGVVHRFPNVLYLILGETHPQERKRRGESYRALLEEKVHNLGLEDHVCFVNRYLSQEELVQYLTATDIYLTPYLNPEQVTSGTLTYALRFGKIVISTPYLSAREALQDGTGILVPFRNATAIQEALIELLEHPEKMHTIEARAKNAGTAYSWDRVGREYVKLFEHILYQARVASFRE